MSFTERDSDVSELLSFVGVKLDVLLKGVEAWTVWTSK